MVHTRAWRNFRRMQDVGTAAAVLIYAGAVLYAFQTVSGERLLLSEVTLLWPGCFLILSLAVPLLAGALRRALKRYVWLSFLAGFGQTASSVLIGIGLLCGAALFLYWQVAGAAAGGGYPAGAFAGYGAGIGILAAQAVLARALEQDPEVRAQIEEP